MTGITIGQYASFWFENSVKKGYKHPGFNVGENTLVGDLEQVLRVLWEIGCIGADQRPG